MDHSIKGELLDKGKKVDLLLEEDILKKIGVILSNWICLDAIKSFLVNLKFLFKCSVVKNPFKIFSFNGFIAGLWIKNKLIEFTTYNFSKKLKNVK